MYSSRYLSQALRAPTQYSFTRTTLRVGRGFRTTAPAATRVSELIKNDHRELEDAYNRILSAKTNDDKERWQNQFTWELARHSIGEELVVYPQMEKVLNNGKTMADHDRHEHQIVSLL